MIKKTENNKKSLRDFLKLGLAAGVATIAGGKILSTLSQNQPEETGNKVKLLSPDGEIVEVDEAHLTAATPQKHAASARDRIGIEGRKFVMVIDLAKCRNARKCVTACQAMHHIDEEQELIQVPLVKDREDASPYWMPKTCFHCDNPPCVKVCPVDATYKRQDGLVLIDNERCIGCKFCMAACPFSTRVFNWEEPAPIKEINHPHHEHHDVYSPETSVPSKEGTVTKCDFCPDMVRMGELPDCITACPNGVIYFGDQNEDVVTNGEETVRFSQLIKDKAGYRFMEDLGTEPRVYYLPPVDRIFPVERGLEDLTEEEKKRYGLN